VRTFVPAESVEEQWDLVGLENVLREEWQLEVALRADVEASDAITDDDIVAKVVKSADDSFNDKLERVGLEQFTPFMRMILLQAIDSHWREHLAALDYLRQGIHLRGYAQKNPKQEYKREAFELFEGLLQIIRNEVTKLLMTVEIRSQEQIAESEPQPAVENVQYHHADYDEALGTTADTEKPAQPQVRQSEKVGRNDPCPCGSGRKYKHCHGKLT
jgi:preprotein translocase subunit SecA